ncbi:5-methyltetrahydropteroyltriglutamate--homocysteine S-methyltransferase [Bradyrhizobium canariense]|uniref:5-methyltetrahydropteroyltriglutamate--homocysteine methyltransferase n=1 Tax=Bradyrhizobium canariense TaxID=255045 RepID=A0A1X3H025_9BRAD|nr:5-methyltetrahydropteroyltriglutamate--homocysteine S-methyltransferase [Bradyrhizobium canariense]OSI65765.1 5-methyltetrahydropteroyltriglutamate--homocysteine S-methyltransferase [Bradyrhizobium canariense]OSI76215.1 5-methyltetrahydropteroyltriglutamate--homocysteine S-methyltransferase [Bradyrhizobium canariense]OSI87630.1 5-methyltetrahydropteroyltriglutamate--homocysteine S-methyltransferase [Bradyrhizobium canariense]OSI87732.1 5-methyltetrahydropteroyltriglutamate--homocysteine S-me
MSILSLPVATLGTSRIGPRRELKFALESYWAGKSSEPELLEAGSGLRAANWARQKSRGATVIPSNDFSLYDHVLDTSLMVGAIPDVYGWTEGPVSLKTYFTMARGAQDGGHAQHGPGVAAQAMTKWFDTNYHYMVPEFHQDQIFKYASRKPIEEYEEARSLGYQTRPVLVGPVTFLKLGKSVNPAFNPLSLLDRLLPVYIDVLRELASRGAEWVQLDEPCLVMDVDEASRAAVRRAYAHFVNAVPALKIMLATYFGGVGDNLDTVLALPVAGLHVDLVRAPDQLDAIVARARRDLVVSLGVVDGRNVWRSNLPALLDRLVPMVKKLGRDRVQIAPSCSLLHVPTDIELETDLDPNLKTWLAFSVQKIKELSILGKALAGHAADVADELALSEDASITRETSPKIHSANVARRMAAIDNNMRRRRSAFTQRADVQRVAFALPMFPTTTIGSFPQTADVRNARAAHARGTLNDTQYEQRLKAETARTVQWQEHIGLDVLVHGEFERNDMVQYFGEQLLGFAFTKHGWVQSYGSRCVRPPILFGDVSRPKPMTVKWWRHAQSLTKKPVKAMLTGPVTILNWSFVRDDIPRSETCRQIALAIRDEVIDLEAAGATMIQIDEAALREGLPLRKSQWKDYLDWAVDSFRVCSSVVADGTQIHTHMCYSEFNEIIDAIAALDADVISIEASRSKMELLDAFKSYKYPNEIGPGVYDIHSPRIPAAAEIKQLIVLARQRVSDRQLWINPDCGLKTRRWEEVRPALVNMVAAARELRAEA